MLKYYKKFFFNSLKSEFANSAEVVGSTPENVISTSNYEKIKSYLEGNTEYKKEDMKDLWKKLPKEEQVNLQDAYEATANAKVKLTELTKEVSAFSEALLMKSLVLEKSKIDDILSDAKITNSDLNSINFKSVQNILSQAMRADFKKTHDFEKKSIDLVVALEKVNKMYSEDLKLVGSRTELVTKNENFENFITNIQTIAAKEMENLMTENENLTAQPLDKKLSQYKELVNNNTARLLILKNIVENELTAHDYRVGYEYNESTSKFSDTLTIVDIANKKVSGNDKIDSILNTITIEDFKTLELQSVIADTKIDSKESLSDRVLVESLLKKHKIEQDGLYYFEDIYDTEKKEDLILIITNKLNSSTDNKDIADFNFLLSYVNTPTSFNKKVFTNSKDLTTIGKVKEEIEKNPADFIEAFKSGKGIKTVLGDIMSSSGGPILMFAAFIGLFMSEYRGTIFKGILGLAGGMALEEVAHKQGWTKGLLEGNNEPTDQKGGVVGEVKKNLNEYFGGSQVKIKNLESKYENNYNALYNENVKKLKNNETTHAIEERDFSQIYAQLVTAPKFNEMTVAQLKQKLSTGAQNSDILGTENVTDYKEGFLDANDKKVNNNRTISSGKVTIFLNMLLNQNDVGEDNKVADLFIQGGIHEATEYVSSDFETENKNISKIFESIPFSDQNKERVAEILNRTDEWTTDNIKAKGFLEDQIKQINSIIIDLGLLSTSTYKNELITEYTKIKTQLDTQKTIDKFETKSNKNADLYLGVSVAKDTANSITSGIAIMAGYFNFNPSWIPGDIKKVTVSDVDKLITEGNAILLADSSPITTAGVVSNVSALPSEQKETLEKMIIELKEKKLTILNAKSQVLTGTIKITNEVLKNETFADLLNTNSTEYQKGLDDMSTDISALKVKPATEDMDGYTSLLLKNYGNVKALQEIIKIDDSLLDAKGLAIKTNAKALLLNVNDYKTNLDAYIAVKKGELTTIATTATRLSTLTTPTTLADLTAMKGLEINKKNIEKEFMNTGTLTDLINGANQYILPSNGQITVVENVTTGLEDSLKKLDPTLTLSTSGTVFETELDSVKTTLEATRINLENRVNISVPLPSPITDITKVQGFITRIKEQDTLINELSDVTKDSKEQDREDIVSSYIDQLILELSTLGANDTQKIANLFVINKLINEKIGDGGNDGFEDAYEKNQEKIVEENFEDSLRVMSLQSAPNSVSKPFNDLLVKYADLQTLFNPIPTNMYDLLDKLNSAKVSVQTFLGRNPNDNPMNDKMNDIDYTINQILDTLKGNVVTVEARKYFKLTSDTIGTIFN